MPRVIRSMVRLGRKSVVADAATNLQRLESEPDQARTPHPANPHATSVTSPRAHTARIVTPISHTLPPVCPIPPLRSNRFKSRPATPKKPCEQLAF
jgi:hypothetical protein